MNTSGRSPIRIVLVDDSELVRMGLRTLLSTEDGLEIVGEANDVVSAVQAVREKKPGLVLLDIRLKQGTGIEACRQILQAVPGTRVLFLTSSMEPQQVDDAIRAGGHGYLLKEVGPQDLIQAVKEVAAGKSVLDPAITARVLDLMKTRGSSDPLASLSAQERRVLELLSHGGTNKEIGLELNLSEKTVKNYLANVFSKLGVNRRAQAVALYIGRQRS